MCGIAGWVGSVPTDSATAVVRRMTATLARRGPDGEGVEQSGAAVLGHRRLSIFDLSSAGSQPMSTPDGELTLVFNGAIYNFRPLRAELESRGHRFRSQTDTEVLLLGYREWGMQGMLPRLRGMFAFGLWDLPRQTLWLVRDRLGVKPLLYHSDGESIAFASTARALRQAAPQRPEIDPAAMLEVLQRGYVGDGRCIWQGVRKLGAGQLLEWRQGEVRQLRDYWQPPAMAETGPSFEDAVAETERLLLQAVGRRLDADVPVGALLSGGIDSSLVCWAIAKLGGDITAFTVGTPGDPADESSDAAETARALGIRHRIIAVSERDTPSVENLVEAYGEPFACSSALGMIGVSAAVRREATVLLTGDGGDDVFLGYPEHRACWAAERLARRLPVAFGAVATGLTPALPAVGPIRKARTLMQLATRGVAGWQATQDRMPYYRQHALLGPRLAGLRVPEPPVEDSLEGGRQLMRDFLIYDRQGRFTGEYMTKVDGGAMFHALEARSPFLDQDLWEFAAALPAGLRLRGGKLKAILRALADKHLGPRVSQGRKRGFTIPVSRWMAGELRPAVERAFADSVLGAQGWIDAAAVRRQLAVAGEKPLPLWYLYVLESWMKAERV